MCRGGGGGRVLGWGVEGERNFRDAGNTGLFPRGLVANQSVHANNLPNSLDHLLAALDERIILVTCYRRDYVFISTAVIIGLIPLGNNLVTACLLDASFDLFSAWAIS